MENKIVYLKTYIITIVILLVVFVGTIGAGIYYYENKIDKLENKIQTSQPQNTGITLVNNLDTSLEGITAQ